jgi:hypothetical protein
MKAVNLAFGRGYSDSCRRESGIVSGPDSDLEISGLLGAVIRKFHVRK